MRPTIQDLAQSAGVSSATADRVVNNRAGVSPRTRALVFAAARSIGYLATDDTAPRPVHLRALLPAGTNRFITDLGEYLEAQAKALPAVTLSITRIQGLDAPAMAQSLNAMPACDGVALVALDHPDLRNAVRRRAAQGIRIVTLASDLPGSERLAYIGIDNTAAGRLAGQIIARFSGPQPTGKIALFAGSRSYHGHVEREFGFRQYLNGAAPALRVLASIESQDHRAQTETATNALLDAHPDLTAIYNAGGGTLGIARALKAAGRIQDIIVVAHEATQANCALLQNGTLDAVIDQDPATEAREALACLTAASRVTPYTPVPPRLQLILSENLPGAPPRP